MIDRDTALKLVREHLEKENLVNHCLAVEACMKEFAGRFEEDPEKWGLTGLLHDLDYQYTLDDPANHTLKTEAMLAEYHLPPEMLHAIKAHNAKAPLDSPLDIALYTVDPTSGFIIACALMHPSKKLENVNLKRMKKRFKEKSFAKGASREQMQECVKMGIELDDFLLTSLTALQKIAPQLGL
jgi:uncharacterized protein